MLYSSSSGTTRTHPNVKVAHRPGARPVSPRPASLRGGSKEQLESARRRRARSPALFRHGRFPIRSRRYDRRMAINAPEPQNLHRGCGWTPQSVRPFDSVFRQRAILCTFPRSARSRRPRCALGRKRLRGLAARSKKKKKKIRPSAAHPLPLRPRSSASEGRSRGPDDPRDARSAEPGRCRRIYRH